MVIERIMHTKVTNKNYLVIFSAIIISLLLYFLVLSIKIPYYFSQFFLRYSIFQFLLFLGLYYFSFRLPRWYSWLAGSSITMMFFALPLLYRWTSGLSIRNIVGGVLPTLDGFYIYHGTQMLTTGRLLPEGSIYFRPPSMGFLSSILLVMRQNLQWSIAVLMVITGLCIYYSGRRVYNSLGAPAGAIFIVLLNFFMLRFVGQPISEWLGLSLGCLAFILLWNSAQTKNFKFTLIGLVILMASMSVRAGAFFVFPMLIVWVGWHFKKNKGFSFRHAVIATIVVSATFLLANKTFPDQIVEYEGLPFDNYAFVVYSQVMGGTEWNRVKKDLGPGNSSTEEIYEAALEEFLKHPISLFISIPKTYRDFFFSPHLGIFSHLTDSSSFGWEKWVGYLIWGIMLVLLFWGLIKSARKKTSPFSMLVVAVFSGIFLSIPFLPPLIAGNKVFAGTMPFLFILIAISTKEIFSQRENYDPLEVSLLERTAGTLSILLVILTFLVPILIYRNSSKPNISIPECQKGQIPFAVKMVPGTYVDLIPEGEGSCGLAPKVCLKDYQANTRVDNVDELFREVYAYSESSDTSTRILLANNLVVDEIDSYRFFIGDSNQFQSNATSNLITGCAAESEDFQLLIVEKIDDKITP